MHVLRLVPREYRDAALALLRRVIDGEVIEDLDGRRRARDGRVLSIAMTLAPIVGDDGVARAAVAVVRDISGRKALEGQLREMAMRDPLTGLFNRRHFEAELERQVALTRRSGQPGALLLLDLDRFKEINDSFGHAAGDVMLRAVSRLLTSLARQGDTVARWGGEEFVVVLPETDLAGAQRFAERLRRTIEAHAVGDMKTSASCGVATMLPEDSVEELLGAADQALYQAKSNGRNRTESAVRGPRPAAA
jgi:diguanylate cyclase (GGDEF)-like protein